MTLLDLRTVLVSTIVVTTVSAVAIGYLWHQHRRQAEGLEFWLAAFFLQWTAVAAIAMRGIIPETVSVLLGSPLVVGGAILLYVGLQRYSGQFSSQRFNILVFASVVAAQTYFAVIQPSLQARHLLLSTALLVICAQCAWLTLYPSKPEQRASTRFIGFIFMTFCFVSVIRMIVDLSVPPGEDFFSSPGSYTAVVLLAYQGLFLGLAFGLFVMVSQRLHSSLEEDIRARRNTEAALRESRNVLQVVVDTSPLAIIVTDSRGIVTLWNTAAQRTFGWSSTEAVGKPSPVVLAQKSEEICHAREDLVQNMTLVAHETSCTRKDGARIAVSLSASELHGSDEKLTGVLVMAADITERKTMEAQLRQQQKLEAIGTLAGGVAHEINNPIAGIMNYAQLIADTVASESRAAEYAREIVAESVRVAIIVRNLLQFARQEQQVPRPARLADLVEQTLTLSRAALRRDQITLTVNVPADLPTVPCRSQQFQQVLMNLLTNARDALNAKHPGPDPDKTITITAQVVGGTPASGGRGPVGNGKRQIADCRLNAGGPANRQSAIANRQSPAWLRLTIADRGPGIPPAVQDRVFDPFFTTKPRDEGTGLGLAISHGIVTEHGGRLTFETTPGEGTRFHVDLPVDAGEAQ